MSRLADYFVIVGYDHDKERTANSNTPLSCGKIIQRFPEKDWPDTPFIEGIEWFCQPLGWNLSNERHEPKFFTSVLTDIDANKHYCACLSFHETLAITLTKKFVVDDEDETVSTKFSSLTICNDDDDDDAAAAANTTSATTFNSSGEGCFNGTSNTSGTSGTSSSLITHHTVMYAPKCLVLISRLDYPETFRNCLGTIYTVYIESLPYNLETLIGNLLGCIQIPPAGGPQVRFSIGAGDKQSLQPPQSVSLPVTGNSVYFLFKQLGIKNVLILLCAVMTENKILFHSKCYYHLTESCKALVALMYPFRYTHVYIPILPAPLAEVLSTPTPFIMGIHSSLQTEVTDLIDVIVVDLDGGLVTIPSSLTPPVPLLPSPLWEQIQDLLTMILYPNLSHADLAFPPLENSRYNGIQHSITTATAATTTTMVGNSNGVSDHHHPHYHSQQKSRQQQQQQQYQYHYQKSEAIIDKELRAIFMRLFAQLLQGYRSCLTLIRIHPKPVITFHKAGFLGARDIIESEFLFRVLDSMFFTAFVNERGPPWRPADAWDELYSSMHELLKTEVNNRKLIQLHISELGKILYENENPNNTQLYSQKILRPPEGSSYRIHQPAFPKISVEAVDLLIENGLRKNGATLQQQQQQKMLTQRNQNRIIPMGPRLPEMLMDMRSNLLNSARRLEVLRTCVAYIFENKITDARKLVPAVTRTLKHHDARLILCRELFGYVNGNKAVLDHQQFDLVIKFMNKALQNATGIDEYTVAAALLPMSTIFCRKLSTGIVQFAYTCIQDHAIWKNLQFWESTFYQDVQTQIKALYLIGGGQQQQHHHHQQQQQHNIRRNNNSPHNVVEHTRKESNCVLDEVRLEEPTALEITAEQMRKSSTIDDEMRRELAQSEESTLYSQAIHYANRMVSLLIPPDVNVAGGQKQAKQALRIEDNHSVTNSILGSHSLSEHSDEGFEENDAFEVGVAVGKIVSRFIDRVCTEGGVTSEHIRNLHDMVPGVVHMHIESLESVYLESQRHPHVQKPKIQLPCLLPGEEFLTEHLRCYLMPDGREDDTQSWIPAEGAIFLTNYRIIFKGNPCDPLACEQTIIRAFPIPSLLKEKKISVLYLAHLDQTLPEGLQLRSSTFQLIKIAFDVEVTPEMIEIFRKVLFKARHPIDEFEHFAFQSYGTIIHGTAPIKTKEKYTTLKGFAKKTLMRTAKKAGFKQKPTNKRKLLTSGLEFDTMLSSDNVLNVETRSLNDDMIDDDEFLEAQNNNTNNTTDTLPRMATAKDLERMRERCYVKDWKRLGLDSSQNGFRLTTVNSNYSMCRSYPALFVTPHTFNDAALMHLGRCYKGQRIPVATWRHRNGALLIRGALPHSKSVIGMLKNTTGSNMTTNDVANYHEQDKYYMSLIETMPKLNISLAHYNFSGMNLSMNSLLLGAAANVTNTNTITNTNININTVAGNMDDLHYCGSLTPEVSRKNKEGRTQRISGNNNNNNNCPTTPTTSNATTSAAAAAAAACTSNNAAMNCSGISGQSYRKMRLYVLGEKSQTKSSINADLGAEFIPVDYPDNRHTRIAFKKLMRACLPSNAINEAEQQHTFAKTVEQSDWLQQISNLLQLAGAVVDLIDLQEASVMLSLEDGSDVTAQVSAIAQVCLDPYYRTIDGFRVLIEKEWLAFGHRFAHRSNLKPNHTSSNIAFAPTFLQFLDVVHQIQQQFPAAFEFNSFYVRFLAYHTVSCRFRTFLFDCELERYDMGIASVEDAKRATTGGGPGTTTTTTLNLKHFLISGGGGGGGVGNNDSDDECVGVGGGGGGGGGFYPHDMRGKTTLVNLSRIGHSVFDYIEKQNSKSPIFYNFMYYHVPDSVLRPQSSVSALELWSYYTNEELAQGPPYDLEVTNADDELDLAELKGKRLVISAGYDNIEKSDPNAFVCLLSEIKQAETEHGHLPQKWQMVWSKLEVPREHLVNMERKPSFNSIFYHGKLQHKRSTLEIIMKGRLSSYQDKFFHPHRFEKHPYTTPTNCNHCTKLLWGPVGYRCMDCGNSYHEKCTELSMKNCTKYKAVDGVVVPPNVNLAQGGDTASIASSAATTARTSSHHFYNQFSSNVAENRTHEGHLYKRGALLKNWKQRWFVLDSIKHQLRYYDSVEDATCKGIIDLAEVQSVTAAQATQIGTKRIDEKGFFDLKTNRRTYNLYAMNANLAQEWIEKIQACLQ